MVNRSSGKRRSSVGFYDEVAARGRAVGLKSFRRSVRKEVQDLSLSHQGQSCAKMVAPECTSQSLKNEVDALVSDYISGAISENEFRLRLQNTTDRHQILRGAQS